MYSNSKSALKKIIIIFLIITLTYYNLVLIGSNLVKGLFSYALDNNSIYNNEVYANEVYTNQVYSNEIDEIYDNEVVCEVNVESTDLHKTRMEENTEFNEKLNINLKNVSDILIEDVANTFYDNEEQETEIANIKYVKTLLNKETLKNLLGEQGTFKVLDKEGNVQAELSVEYINSLEEELNTTIEENNTEETETPVVVSKPQKFTKIVEIENEQGEIVEEEHEEIRSYVTISEETVEITYELEVKEIIFNIENINPEFGKTERIEDEKNVEEEIDFVIENTKSVFAVQDLDNLNYLKEDINYTFNKETNIEESEEEQTEGPQIQTIVKFKDTVTRAQISIDSEEWTLGEENVVNYSITLNTSEEKSELFKNPIFVLELPSCVDEVLAENSQFTVENDGGVFTEKHVSVVALAGRKYIVVTLEGEQTEESISENGNTIITLSLAINVADEGETNQETKLYYQNDTVTAYESGAGFDTDTVNISLILATEDGETIVETETPVDNGEPNEEDIEEPISEEQFTTKIYFNEYRNEEEEHIVRTGEEFEYVIALYNSEMSSVDIRVEDILPDGFEFVGATLFNYNDYEWNFTDEVNIEQNVEYNPQTRKLTITIDNFEPAQLETVGTELIEVEDEETGELITEEIELKDLKQTAKLLKIKVKPVDDNLKAHSVDNEIRVFKNNLEHSVLNMPVYIDNNTVEFSVKEIPESLALDNFAKVEITLTNNGKTKSDPVNIEVNVPEELKFVSVEEYNYSSGLNSNEYSNTMVLSSEQTRTLVLTAKYINDPGEDKNVGISIKVNGEERVLNTTLLTKVTTPNNPDNPTEPTEPTEASTGPVDNPGHGQGGNQEEKPTDGNEDGGSQTNKPQVDKKEFDLSLKQSIQKIVVTNSNGTETYNYNKDTSVGKIEIHAKQMNGSTVSIDYIITIKNNGTENGYARKIVDYLPEGMTFTSELNPDWYMGEDGNIYSVKFIDKVLKPGEEVEIKLVLLKQMTDQNTGTVENVAEIYEATNDEGLEDINSIPGNKLPKENDMSSTQVIIAVKTGRVVIYLLLALTILAILVYGIYNTRKVTLKSKGDK